MGLLHAPDQPEKVELVSDVALTVTEVLEVNEAEVVVHVLLQFMELLGTMEFTVPAPVPVLFTVNVETISRFPSGISIWIAISPVSGSVVIIFRTS